VKAISIDMSVSAIVLSQDEHQQCFFQRTKA